MAIFGDFLILMPKAISQDASSELIILQDRFFGNSRVEKWPINQSYQIRGSNRTGDVLGDKSPWNRRLFVRVDLKCT